jgi:hypothetical protein
MTRAVGSNQGRNLKREILRSVAGAQERKLRRKILPRSIVRAVVCGLGATISVVIAASPGTWLITGLLFLGGLYVCLIPVRMLSPTSRLYLETIRWTSVAYLGPPLIAIFWRSASLLA